MEKLNQYQSYKQLDTFINRLIIKNNQGFKMLFTFDKKSRKISTYEETDLKSHKILERQDMEKWVEDYPEILGEEIKILTTEYDRFDKTNERLDLLGLDKQGDLVIIELKRDDSGKTVELQALKYAAYCSTLTLNDIVKMHKLYLEKKKGKINEDDVKKYIIDFIDNDDFEEINDKPRIILVSKEYRPEVTASILWLRKFDINIKCVKLTPYLLNNDTIAFESNNLIPLPEAEDFIIKTEKKENIKHTMTLTQEEYLKFYSELVSRIKTELPINFFEPHPASSRNR